MVEIRKPIPVRDAIERVMTRARPLGSETVLLADSYGRLLAEPVVAAHDVPPFPRSPYDGFAIRSADSSGANEQQRISFCVIEHLGAGDTASRGLGRGEAMRIMTGAAMPAHADAVVMLEQTKMDEQTGTFTIRKPFRALENVSLQGEDVQTGEMLIEAGELIHPGTIALLATFGYDQVKVARRPSVGLIATGSELLDVDEPLAPGKIRNSNGPMIAGQLARLRVPYRSYGIMKDNLEDGLALMQRALEESDCVITTGGVSVGDFDYLPAIYERLGAEVLFNKVAMRPGSVTTVAALGDKLLFGLSGNPSACFIGFELFTRPALLSMMGGQKPYLSYTQAMLAEDFNQPNPFTRFIRAVYHYDGQRAMVSSAGFNKSNAVSSIARGNAIIVLPGGSRDIERGELVDVLLLGMEDGERQWRIP